MMNFELGIMNTLDDEKLESNVFEQLRYAILGDSTLKINNS